MNLKLGGGAEYALLLHNAKNARILFYCLIIIIIQHLYSTIVSYAGCRGAIPKQYHLKCTNNIDIVLYLGFADIILVAFNKIEIFIQDTGYRTCGVSPLNRHS